MKRLCLEPTCAEEASYRGRCQIHARHRERETHAKPGRMYSRKRWIMLRRRQLSIEPLCRECGEIATDVDHIRPMSEGGEPWSLANLQSLCVACHSRKTAKEMARR